MKNLILHIAFVALLGLFGCGGKEITSTPERPAPEWVSSRPINPTYYIGIGSVSKIAEPVEFATVAKKNALNDLASEISVTVKSESFLNTMQVNSQVQEEFRSNISTFSDEKIEGFELVDAWENGTDYFVYYRLSRSMHEQIRQEKKREVMRSGYDYLIKARDARNIANIPMATDLYLRGIFEMKEYWNDVNKWEDQGEEIYLDNTLYQELKSMLNNVHITASANELVLNAGNNYKEEIGLLVSYETEPAKGVRVEYRYDNDKYRNTKKAKTDISGTVRVMLNDASLINMHNQIEAYLDLNDLKPADLDKKYVDPLFDAIRVQHLAVPIRAELPVVFIQAEENNLGHSLGTQRLADPMREAMDDRGFEFTGNINNADFVVSIEADTKEGGTSQGFHVSFLEMKYTVTDKEGHVLLQSSESNIKGLQLNFEAAGLEAYKKAVKLMERTIAEDIIDSML